MLSHNPFLGKIFIIQTLRQNRIFTHNGCIENVTLCNLLICKILIKCLVYHLQQVFIGGIKLYLVRLYNQQTQDNLIIIASIHQQHFFKIFAVEGEVPGPSPTW